MVIGAVATHTPAERVAPVAQLTQTVGEEQVVHAAGQGTQFPVAGSMAYPIMHTH